MEESSNTLIRELTNLFKLILISGEPTSEVEYRENVQDTAHLLNITIQQKDKGEAKYEVSRLSSKFKTQYNTLPEETGSTRRLYFIKET